MVPRYIILSLAIRIKSNHEKVLTCILLLIHGLSNSWNKSMTEFV